ncbi:50S ribosomal protein L32 [Candidatus Dependentiae bacterium]|nr:50S ribosomal protein L32 [Candidatus Dependentiae bacterium]
MPVPKRKTSKARRDSRQANKHIRPQAITSCLNCGHAVSPHQVCEECGFYKGEKVLRTKHERAIKRVEQVQAVRLKEAQSQAQAPEGQAHDEGK